jgi:lipopolysaccharide biosynthesis glycosyltransferase
VRKYVARIIGRLFFKKSFEMKTCIFVLALGNIEAYKFCLAATEKYSHKYQIPLILGRTKKFNFINNYFEKFQCLELLDTYDRVLCIDADIMPTPNARNIFEEYPDENYLYAYHESTNDSAMNRDPWIASYSPDFSWPMYNDKKQYFNGGCVLYSKKHRHIPELIKNITYTQKCFSIEFGEQTALNYVVAKHQFPFKSLDYSFNRMHLGKLDPNNERYKADFIHYAGPCTYVNGNKQEAMAHDFRTLYRPL